ncbi:MAG: hypothetical protein ACXABY_28360 [Candidatus Thorarchaeota archaeon]|jgi:hypothetical protein
MLAFLDGYKTYIAGVGMICTGIGMVCTALVAEYFDAEAVWEGVTVIAGGFGMMGFRHALTKKEEVPPPQ